MKSVKMFGLLVAGAMLASGVAQAESAKQQLGVRGGSGGGYGPAGCGLGSLLFEPSSGFTQIFAATTNGTFASQTFGISTGTSNCDSGGGGSASAKAFVQTNRVALAKDAARGSGETIDSLAELAGCQDSTAVGSALQKHFDELFPSADASNEQVSDAVVETLRSDASLQCSNVG